MLQGEVGGYVVIDHCKKVEYAARGKKEKHAPFLSQEFVHWEDKISHSSHHSPIDIAQVQILTDFTPTEIEGVVQCTCHEPNDCQKNSLFSQLRVDIEVFDLFHQVLLVACVGQVNMFH